MVEHRQDQLDVNRESFDAFIDLLGRLIARRHRMTAGSQTDPSTYGDGKPHDATLSQDARRMTTEYHDQLEQAG